MKNDMLLLLALSLLPLSALASQEAEQRAAIEARFAADSRECAQHFIVSSCMDEAKERRRTALKPVIAREQEQAAQARREKALAQAKRVQQRQQEAGASEAKALSVPLRASEPRPIKAEIKPRVVADPAKQAAAREAKIETAELDAARNQKKLTERQTQMRLRQQEAARNAKKIKPKGASTLPTPTAADIAKLSASAASR